MRVPGEACDDGNFSDGDGCPSDCSEIEPNWICPVDGDYCVQCGNSIVERAGVHRRCVGGDNPGADCSDSSEVCQGSGSCEVEHRCSGGDSDGADCTTDETVCSGSPCEIVADFAEVCDDGNRVGGDGCSADCSAIEEGWICSPPGAPCRNCGDGVLQATEACDDGRQCDDGSACESDADCALGACTTRDGDGCAADCLGIADNYRCPVEGELCELCGDRVLDPGEVCDDGNADGGDGCAANCQRLEAGWACSQEALAQSLCTLCGDGVIEGVEVCDDGNGLSGDGCSADCSTVEADFNCFTAGTRCVRCGNGVVQSDEACDDGNTADGDGCSADCLAIEPGWECPVPGLQCGNCGDGALQAIETCDDGNNDGGDGCTADCGAIEPYYACPTPGEPCERCGNGVRAGDEVCDDGGVCSGGGSDDGSVCTSDGDCNAGSGTCTPWSGDGCASSCGRIETGFQCETPLGALTTCTRCGDSVIEGPEVCDDGNASVGDGCSADCTMVENNYNCFTAGSPCVLCGNGALQSGEACDDGNVVDGDGCSADCLLIEPGWVCPVAGLECGNCGDGLLQAVETCDDANNDSGDGCTGDCGAVEPHHDCHTPGVLCERCGNGLLLGDEACDDGGVCSGGAYDGSFCTADSDCDSNACVPVGGDGCRADCSRVEGGWQCILASNTLTTCTFCGDGVEESPEACDDGNANNGDGCSADCTVIEDDYNCFTPGAPCALCGNGIREQDEACDDGDTVGGDGCNGDCMAVESGWNCSVPGLDCSYCSDGVVDFPEVCDDGGHCVVSADGTDTGVACRTDAECNSGEICQPMDGDGCAGDCLSIDDNYNCPTPGEPCELCGDGAVDASEACDDGNVVGGDGCAGDCQTVEANYACYAAGQPCTECGDGTVGKEICIGGVDDGAGCSLDSDCDSGVCGPEACDDLNTVSGDGCAGDCSMVEADYNCFVAGLPCVLCGNGTQDAGEACDEGAYRDGVGCSGVCTEVDPGYDCRVPGLPCAQCGDGTVTDGVEACDDGNAVGGDGCTGDCTAVEDHYTCTTAGEPCERCGDGVRREPEVCDDGSTCVGGGNAGADCTDDSQCPDSTCEPSGSDGCSRTCDALEPGWDCSAELDALTVCSFCGDGQVEGSEECDDGRRCVCGTNPGASCGADFQCGDGGSCSLIEGDGCDTACQLEPGYNCFVPGAPCVECGDGVVSSGEACDEGYDADGVGCAMLCTVIETDYLCPFPGYACALCGNRVVESTVDGSGNILPLETCDDGDRLNGDGCDATCQVEDGYDCEVFIDVCVGGGDEGSNCSSDGDCSGGTCESLANCVAAGCGDGFVAGDEQCDDGNDQSGDGCSVVCQLEDGYVCDTPDRPCTLTVCGDGVVEGDEQCDDSGSADPGCDADCQLEDGYVCPLPGESCLATTCGDGFVEGSEECDDPTSAGTDGDGCSASCRLESGYACTTDGTACNGGGNADGSCVLQVDCPGGICSQVGGTCYTTTCGDGLVEGSEQCDDGDTADVDGCSATCTVEELYACNGEPSECQPVWSFVSIRQFNVANVNPPALHYDPTTRSFIGYKATQDKAVELCLDGTVFCEGCTDGPVERTRPVAASGSDSFEGATYDPFSLSALFLQGDGTLTQIPRGSHCVAGADDGDVCLDDDGCDSGICERWIDTLSSTIVCVGGSNDGERVATASFCDSGTISDTGAVNMECDAASTNAGAVCSGNGDCSGGSCIEARTTYAEVLRDDGGSALDPTGLTLGEDGRLYVAVDGPSSDYIWYFERGGAQAPGTNNISFNSQASGSFALNWSEFLGLFTVPGAGLIGSYSAISSQGDLRVMFYEDTSGVFAGSSTIPGLLFPDESVTFGDTGDGQETASDGGSFIICQKSNGNPCQLFARTCENDLDCASVAPGTQCDPLQRCTDTGLSCDSDADCESGTCEQISRCLGGPVPGDVCTSDADCGGGGCTAVNFCNLPGSARDDRSRVPSGAADHSIDVLQNDILGQTACTDPTKRVVRLQDQDGTWVSDRICVGGGSAGMDCSADPELCGTGSCESAGSVLVTTALGGSATIADNGELVGYNPGSVACGQQDSFDYAAWLGGSGAARLIDTATVYIFIECVCGNALAEPGEECDCGDGVEATNPDCSSVNGPLPARCSSECTVNVVCGDEIVDPGEECDNGRQCDGGDLAGEDCSSETECTGGGTCAALSGDGCSSSCQLETVCGNGVVEGVEECEPVDTLGDPNPGCTDNCTLRYCGDGTVDVNDEECDDGENNSDTAADACRTDCTLPRCGDGVTDSGEECDGQADCDVNFCLVVSCGNGSIEGSEQCDDGGTLGGDGCDSTCRLEPVCGNGHLEGSEECDDGNTIDGDGCRDTSGALGCTLELCGDGVPDPAEACDYGQEPPSACENADLACIDSADCGGDACVSVICTVSCEIQPVCGDGRLDSGEDCDDGDGNAETADASCRTDCSLPGCGDGVVDSGEECDDGNTTDGDGCSATCVDEQYCGNGVVDPDEQCDDGNTVSGDGCRDTSDPSLGCTEEICGDGMLDPGTEECDPNDPTAPDGEVCTSDCRIQPVCGNALVEGTEQCDEGELNAETADAPCRTDCTLQGCGDGVVDSDEECDDGNTTSGDGCNDQCVIEPAVCGDGIVNGDDECDDGNTTNGDGCRDTSDVIMGCTIEVCGDGLVDAPGEECDPNDPDAPEGQVCTLDCSIQPVCGNALLESGEACDEGDLNAETPDATCRTDCTAAGCGDGVHDSAEECDDGNNTAGDGCDESCLLEPDRCGDGRITGSEDCDDGNTVSGDGCRGSEADVPPERQCQLELCGDGHIDTALGETCDDGNSVSGDGCSNTCALETVCGDGVVEGVEECDDGGESGDCDLCSPTCTQNTSVCGNGIIESGEECDDPPTEPDSCTPPVGGDGCDANCQLENVCGDGSLEGEEECDDGAANSDKPDANCRTDCTLGGCGDGILDSGEECDDGNDDPADRCSNTCTDLRTCGDGIVDADLAEECDDGNNVSGDGCSSACQSETVVCGDGVTHSTEQCDDGNTESGDGCSSTCELEGDFCGDGIVGTAEDCDNGGLCEGGSNDGVACSGADGCPDGTCVHQESETCRGDCSAPYCGDGILDTALGEQCDPPGDCSCDSMCQVTLC
ncbi:MAG: DUF4215 domain-containing protein [Myxococcales bacterium]|nr:DUF4215 domain-containing protein [Myxococcales bacterium]